MQGKAVQGHEREREDSSEGESVKTARLQGSGSKRRVEEDGGGASSKRARGDDDAGNADERDEARAGACDVMHDIPVRQLMRRKPPDHMYAELAIRVCE